jgi:hypothetical protein
MTQPAPRPRSENPQDSHHPDQQQCREFGEMCVNALVQVSVAVAHLRYARPVCGDLIDRAKDKRLRVKGPVRLPTKILKITTRKSVNHAHSCRHMPLD